MPQRRPILLLIDGSSLVYRSYFGMLRGGRDRNAFRTRDGRPTGAVYGLLMTLRKLIAESNPDLVAIAFDSREPTFRHAAFPAYKAHREAMPDDLVAQLPAVERAVEALRIHRLRAPGYEADDLIGTATRSAVAADCDVTIVSGDKDLYQLLGDHVDMLRVRGAEVSRITAAEVPAEFGVRTDQVVDVLALWGDKTDNIPGVRGIGERRAIELILAHGDLAGVYRNLDAVRPALAELLRSGEAAAQLSRRLATIVTDLPLGLEPREWRRVEPDVEALLSLCRELEFQRLANELARPQPAPALRFESSPPGAPAHATALSVEVDLDGGRRGSHLGVATSEALIYWDLEALSAADLDRLRTLLRSPEVKKHSFDRKATRRALRVVGLDLDAPGDDVALLAYLLDPGRPVDAQALATELLGRAPRPAPAAAPVDERQGNLFGDSAAGTTQAAAEAVVARAELTAALQRVVLPRVVERGLEGLYRDLELPLTNVLLSMEERGIRIDRDRLVALQQECRERRAALERVIHTLAGERFNIGSSQQVAEILFERMRLPGIRRTQKSGAPSTDNEVLAELARDHELPRRILEHRELSKLIGAYLEPLPGLVDPRTGRVHTTFQQTVTATGRLSSSDPNLQNIPVRSELGREIRAAFTADPGCQLVAADYSQIELRLLAHLSRDEALLAAFRDGADIHQRTAARMFGVAPELVTTELRRRAKVLNFGIIYGMSAHGLARELDIPTGEAKKLIHEYFAGYSGVRAWLDNTVQEARKDAEIRTMFGRVRRLPQIQSSHNPEREYAERIAVNTPIQGAAADLIKMAMLVVDRRLAELPHAHLLLQVHDELVVECRDEDVTAVRALLDEAMSGVVTLAVPLTVSVGAGVNWRDAK